MLKTPRLERVRLFNSRYSGSCFAHRLRIWQSEAFFENPYFFLYSDEFEIKTIETRFSVCFTKNKGYSVNWRKHI